MYVCVKIMMEILERLENDSFEIKENVSPF